MRFVISKFEKFKQSGKIIKCTNISSRIGILIHFNDTIYKTK